MLEDRWDDGGVSFSREKKSWECAAEISFFFS